MQIILLFAVIAAVVIIFNRKKKKPAKATSGAGKGKKSRNRRTTSQRSHVTKSGGGGGANNRRKKTGFADTKRIPHKQHPAFYRKKGSDEIEYVTFTHSPKVLLENGKEVETIPLTDSVSIEEQEFNKRNPTNKKISHVYPRVYNGKRSALGGEKTNYSLIAEDKKIVDTVFDTCPVVNVTYTSNTTNKKANNNAQ